MISNMITLKASISNNSLDKAQNNYPLIDIARSWIPQTDFIVNMQPLRDKLRQMVEEEGQEKVSIYVEYLNTGANISINQEARYFPASLIKMPAAVAAAKKIQDGQWSWDSELVLLKEDVDPDFGEMYKDPIGTRYSIGKLLENLLTKSDNTAYLILLRNVGKGGLEDFLISTGLEGLFDEDLNVTAREYTRIFRSLYSASYLNREYSQIILDMLSKATNGLYLDKGLPDDAAFAHKFGENAEINTFADSGIVYLPNRPYLVTVMYKGDGSESKKQVDDFFENVGREVYEYFKNHQNN